MTVAVSCNLSEGIVLAVDSAVTVHDPGGGVAKVYENAEKLFQLGDRPIGVAMYNLGSLGSRSLGSYVTEFETLDPGGVLGGQTNVADIVEALRTFFGAYRATVVPVLEANAGVPFKDLPADQIPVLGIVVGGFSAGAFLSEVWEIIVPIHATPGSAVQHRGQGNFGTNWFATSGPIQRYIKGFDVLMLDEVVTYLTNQRGGQPLTPQETADIQGILAKHEYPIPFFAMPMEEGVEHARFLAQLVVSHHRYASGAPVVGGDVRVGRVGYRGGRFEILGL